MNDLQQNQEFIRALKLQQIGNLPEAKNAYLTLLRNYANSPRLLNNLAIIEFQQGRFENGIEYLEKSIYVNPNQFNVYGNRGAAFFAINRFDEAYSDYNKAIALNINYAEAYYNRGILHERFKNVDAALADYDKAIQLRPDYTNAHNNRGNLLVQLKRFEEASLSYIHAIRLNPRHAEAHYNLGGIFKELKNYTEALSSYQQAIALNNHYVEAFNNCGNVLLKIRRFKDAIEYFQKAIKINLEYAFAFTGLGIAYMELKNFDEAHLNFDKAILFNSRTLDQAADIGLHKGNINSDIADAYWNKAILKILLSEYEEGWQLYEYRRYRNEQKESYPDYDQPLWLGQESVKDKLLYIYPEQGFGDFIQFCRYIPLVEKLGASVTLRVPTPLISLIKSMGLNAKIVKNYEEVDAFDLHCPIMSLPLAFKTTLENIPNAMPYLFADAAKKHHWQKKMAESTSLKVGLVWSGSKDHRKDHDRSLRLEQLKPLFNLPVAFYSLQKEVREEDQATLFQLSQIQQQELKDFSDTAAMVDCLDLIITVDTSVAHLAGAMAKNVWILISYLPDYRWMLDRDDAPWYPTATLFRQPAVGDWDSVIINVKAALAALLRTKM